jgi:hypothetical protein
MTDLTLSTASTIASPRRPPGGAFIAAAVLGPLLLVLSALLNHTPASQSAADVLVAVADHRGSQLAEVLLEMTGFVLTFTACISAAIRLQGRGRGSRVAVAGWVGCLAGLIGFTLVGAEGLVLNALAGMAEHDAAVRAVDATNHSPAVFIALPLILIGELGIVAVLAAHRRAGLLPVWPLIAAVLALVVDFAGSSRAMLAVSDLLGLIAVWWLAAATVRRTT